jgi:hypothetical protein
MPGAPTRPAAWRRACDGVCFLRRRAVVDCRPSALRGCAGPLAGRGRSTGIRAYGVRGFHYWDSTDAIILDVLYGDTTPLIDEIDVVFDGFLYVSKVRAVALPTSLVVDDDGMSTVEYSTVCLYFPVG